MTGEEDKMIHVTLFGWDHATWARAIKWAGSDLSALHMFDVSRHADLLAVRIAWLKADGPIEGPVTDLVDAS